MIDVTIHYLIEIDYISLKCSSFFLPSLPLTDANKRKLLPAWIRLGLEKMEQEKQKAAEKKRLEKERKDRLEAQKKAENDIINQARIKAGLPPKSKFDEVSWLIKCCKLSKLNWPVFSKVG